ncbi:hypothetical protein ACOXXX_14105 [Thalassococcus sp. BH17M4-6]|uniref:hypothetical protein n=1 Tax=Thalassococcus sp. BH17M4-6 TaxID=3413148 RepID=UPI003BE1036E
MKFLPFLALLLTGCASVGYNTVKTGTFTGSAVVVWVGAGDESVLGDGEFLYVPVNDQRLRFTRPVDADAPGGPLTIEPEAFYTDGGSVPRAVQALRGLNAWAYGPAYVIHDWVFVARKCLNDADENGQFIVDGKNVITDEMRKIAGMRFRDSAVLMAETIRTLAQDYDIDADASGALVSGVTAGPISRGLWNAREECEGLQVTDPDHLRIIADLQGRNVEALARTLGDTRSERITASGGQEYRVVAAFNLDRPAR